MFTSDTDSGKRSIKLAFTYLLITIITALFGAVYEKFSHGVYSYSMLYAFAYPLIGGVLPYLSFGVSKKAKLPPNHSRLLCHFGVSTLTVGSIIQGVLEIYGTTNALTYVFPVVGGILFISGVITSIIFYLKK